MEKNRADSYLRSVRKINRDIRNIEDAIRDAREEQTLIRSTWPDGQPHGTGMADPTAQAIIDLEKQISRFESQLIQKRSHLWKAKMEIIETIGKVRGERTSRMLYLYYVEELSWEEVAVKVHYSWRHTMRKRKTALREVEKMLDETMS